MNRRTFLFNAGLTVAAVGLAPGHSFAQAAPAKGVKWPIGCFNRPWAKWGYDVTLDSVKAAGYGLTGLLTRSKTEPFTGDDATPEYLAALKKKIADHGLSVNMAALRSRHNIPVEDSIKEVRKQLDNAKFLSLEYMLTFGVDKADQYENYYQVMADAAAYAQDKGIKLVMKPHGGGSGAAEEILRCLEKVKHANFKIWYDAGNIIYYTGKDPVAELEPIVQHVTGFCAKDCGGVKSEVMIQFGDGKVDFQGVFKKLKGAGFNGPVMVECCAIGATPEVTAENARKNLEFLERTFAAI